jgi:DNA-binding helix-hairpin-helix protein with protein kinase domain
MLRIISVDDGRNVTIAAQLSTSRRAAYRGSMTTSTLTAPPTRGFDPAARAAALAQLRQLRSDLHQRETAYVETRAKLLLAYRLARREGFSDTDLSGSAGTLGSIASRSE